MVVEVKIEGLEQIKKDLKKMSKEGQRKAAQTATSKMSGVFKREILSQAPVKTGKLKRHIRQSVTKGRTFQGYQGKIGLWTKKGKDKNKDFPFYARFIEMGASGHEIKPKNAESLSFAGGSFSGADHPGVAAKPFIRPSFNSKKGEALRVGTKTFVDQIRKYWK